MLQSRLLRTLGLLLASIAWLANSSNPPNGRTGAPFDNHCNGCHGGSNPNGFAGTVEVDGLPAEIAPNITYPLTLTMTTTGAGVPTRGGFQLVAVAANNTNAGDLSVIAGQGTGTETSGGREYMEHRNAKNFSGAGSSISWTFNWKAPATANGNQVKFYYIGNFCNNTSANSSDNGDFMVTGLTTVNMAPAAALDVTVATTNALCFGTNTGSATANVTGNAGPFTYAWSNSGTTQTINNLAVGNYSVTVTSADGATGTASGSVSQPSAALAASTSVSGSLSCLVTEVSVSASATGGTQPYTYNWPGGLTGSPVGISTPGTYVVTVTDDNGCTRTASATVGENVTAPLAEAGTGGTLTCITPQLTLSGAGSSTGPNFSYAWSTVNGSIASGNSTLTPTITQCGTYQLEVTNNTNGCTATDQVTVLCNVTPPTVTVSTPAVLTCTNTSVVIQAQANPANCTYAWSGPSFNSSLQNPTVTAAGTYTVTVTNPANGCTSTASATVTSNVTPPTVTVSNPTLTCANPSVIIQSQANPANSTYAWSGPSFSSTLQNPTVTAPGTYTVTVTNPANGCTATATSTVAANQAAPTLSLSGGSIRCNQPQTEITVSAPGSNLVGFVWTGPGIVSGNGTETVVVNAPGLYSVVVTNSTNGCTSQGDFNVADNTTPPTVSIVAPGALNCTVNALVLNAAASSQGPAFTYAWTGPGVVMGINTLTPTINQPGSYTLVVTNTTTGCTASSTVLVEQTSGLTLTTTATANVSCFGGQNGAAEVTVDGGAAPYTYAWSNSAASDSITGLAAGVYNVTVSDVAGCSASASVTISQPNLLVANATATGETSAGGNDGTVSTQPQGGTPFYTFLWSNGNTFSAQSALAPGAYTITLTDSKGCSAVETVNVAAFNCSLTASIGSTNVTCFDANNGTATVTLGATAIPPFAFSWSNSSVQQQVNNLAPGNYTVTVSDSTNCSVVLSTVITQPLQLFANATATAVTSANGNDGTASAVPTGGVEPYTYLWSTEATTATVFDLTPGLYSVTVTDANGCSVVQTVTVNAFDCQVTATASVTLVGCEEVTGSVTANLIGGPAPLKYLWSTGSTEVTIENLPPGEYGVTVTDANGCAATATALVLLPDPLEIQIQSVANVACPSDNTGSFMFGILGGTPPYAFSLPGINGQLSPGTYNLSVTDGRGCFTSGSVTIGVTDIVAPTITCTPSFSECDYGLPIAFPPTTAVDNCAGSLVNIEQIGGLPNNSFFPEGATVQVFKATDTAGNTSTCSFTLTVYAIPDVLLVSVVDDLNGSGVGSIDVTPVGGTPPYIFSWDKDGAPFAETEDISGLTEGLYLLTLLDANGCGTVLSAIQIDNVVGTSNPVDRTSLTLQPNPTQHTLLLKMNGLELRSLDLVDQFGRLVRQVQPNEWNNPLDVSILAPGTYLLRGVDASGRVVVARFVKI